MKSTKYIVVVPMMESKLDLLRFGGNRYTWVSFWHDLRDLHGKRIFQESKIFVDQLDPESSPPKLFICTLVNAKSEEEAFKRGTENVLSLSNNLALLLEESFEPEYHEAIVIPFHPTSLPPTIEHTIGIEVVRITAKNGKVEEIATPYSTYKPRFALPGKAVHDKYATTYFRIPKIEPGTSKMPTIHMSPKEYLLDVEHHLQAIRVSKSSGLMDLVATLYGGAIATENMSVSYLLLWQVLESVASSKSSGKRLINENTKKSIRKVLQQEGYDAQTLGKVDSVLGVLKEKTESEIIAETLWDYLHPAEGIDRLKQKVEKFRSIRGTITHPRLPRRLDTHELVETYAELRDIVERLVHKLVHSENETKA